MTQKFALNLIFLNLVIGLAATAQNMNQVGYLPGSVKRVFVSEVYQNKSFHIENDKGEEVLTGQISEAKYWKYSGTSVAVADFSTLQKPGEYTVVLPGANTFSITIDKEVYKKLGKNVVKMYYHARASMPIDGKYAGIYARPAGHPDNVVTIHRSAASKERPEGSSINSPGGWYDAGDYNKYIVNSSISTFTLLHLVEMYKTHIQDVCLNIPESDNNSPDILDEALYNLKWMLTMQDPNDGGVYHKLTTKKFCGMIMPHEDHNPRYVVMKTTAATLDFAATMAKAYRVLQSCSKDYPNLAERCKEAALKAWEWCRSNPNLIYNQPRDIATGAYGDTNLGDEKLWAATELYLSTGDKKYLIDYDFNTEKFDISSWRSVASLSLYSLLIGKENKKLKEVAALKLKDMADKYYKEYSQSAYKVSITTFPWGSNGVVANQGMMFMHAYKLTNNEKYLEAADACLGYILGANPTAYCFVTGFGKKSPKQIHERRSVADCIDEPIPGFLVGGPTLQAQNDCGKEKYPSEFPALAYLDEECSYSSNEIAINWNAPLAFLVWSLDAELR